MRHRLQHRRRVSCASWTGEAAAETKRQTLQHAIHGKRHHHSGNAEHRDADAVAEADDRAHAERQRKRQRHARVAAGGAAHHQDRAGVQRPRNRKVDAADENHEGLSGRDNAHEAGNGEDRLYALERGKPGPDEAAGGKEHDRRRDRVKDPALVLRDREPRRRRSAGTSFRCLVDRGHEG
jgi:hypothetical protein